MKRAMLATLLMVLCSSWALAQQDYGQKSDSSSSGTTTVQGCLNKSDSGYTLTDKSGTTYQLTGDTSKLSDHVGHEVEITGTQSGAGTGDSTAATQQSTQHQIDVSSLKHISTTCSSATSSGQEKSPDKSSEKPPMSDKPPKH
jgi:uncharacterized protein DUF5818